MDSFFNSFLVNQMLTGGTIWLYAAFLSAMLIALIFRPQHVRSRELVLVSIIFFAAALIVPSFLLISTMETGSSNAGAPVTMRWSMFLGPTLFGISAILGTLALLPSRGQIAEYQNDELRRREREDALLEPNE